MIKRVLLSFLLSTCGTAFAQSLEPGEWEFNAVTTVTSAPVRPGEQTNVFRRCIRQEDADEIGRAHV